MGFPTNDGLINRRHHNYLDFPLLLPPLLLPQPLRQPALPFPSLNFPSAPGVLRWIRVGVLEGLGGGAGDGSGDRTGSLKRIHRSSHNASALSVNWRSGLLLFQRGRRATGALPRDRERAHGERRRPGVGWSLSRCEEGAWRVSRSG